MKKQWMTRALIKSFFCAATIGVLLGGLSACDREPTYVENPIIKNLSDNQRRLLGEIESSGIQVIKEGMVFTFVIPTDCFFVKQTRALTIIITLHIKQVCTHKVDVISGDLWFMSD